MIRANTDTQQEPERPKMSDPNCPAPVLMTEAELIVYLRIDVVSTAENLDHVVENLRRMHGLPCIHICRKPLYPQKAVDEWIDEQCEKEKKR